MNTNAIVKLNLFGLLGISLVLLFGSFFQFVWNELPCPLCLLQRLGFIMVMFGFSLNLRYGIEQRHYGIVLIGALYGVVTSLRQVSLHILPGTPGYGSMIFGMHYYTWSFIIFTMTIGAVAVLLIFWKRDYAINDYSLSRLGEGVIIFAIVIVVINAISVLIECGPYECPADPVSYWLFDVVR